MIQQEVIRKIRHASRTGERSWPCQAVTGKGLQCLLWCEPHFRVCKQHRRRLIRGGELAFVSPLLEEKQRAALLRVALEWAARLNISEAERRRLRAEILSARVPEGVAT